MNECFEGAEEANLFGKAEIIEGWGFAGSFHNLEKFQLGVVQVECKWRWMFV